MACNLFLLMVLVSSVLLPRPSHAGAFIFASESTPHRILHPQGYTGSQNSLFVEVCIDPASQVPSGASLTDAEQSIINNIQIWNQLQPEVGNAKLGSNNNIPSGRIDFESVALHELGHCIGLAHVNAASESGLSGSDQNYTKAGEGTNNSFDTDPGSDGVIGTLDDLRGDDVNLHWFRIDNNDPGALPLPLVVDSSTYSRDLGMLPSGHLFAQNLDRDAAGTMGHTNTSTTKTEAVMQQLSYTDEDQRSLTADGVATLMLGMSGVDEAEGTSDDYSLTLVYGGISSASSCDLTMRFTNMSGLAFCSVGASSISNSHYRITSGFMEYGAGFNWFFNQEDDPCSYSVNPTSDSYTATGGSGNFAATAVSDCYWRPAASSSWITVTSGVDNGDGTVTYTVAANTGSTPRSGTVSVGGKTHSISQAGITCNYSILPTSSSFTAAAGSGSFGVTVTSGCSWNPVRSASWITLNSGSDSGNGTVSFSVSANNNVNPRSGTITVGGEIFNITQDGASCSYTINPGGDSFTATGGSDSFNVTAPTGCGWTPTKSDAWITLNSGAGNGNGSVSYSVAANPGINARSGTITVQDKTFNISQSGLSCSYAINPGSGSFTTAAGTDSFSVIAPTGCGWTPSRSANWITLNSGAGSGNGSVSYSVAENTDTNPRSGTITVGGQIYNITQDGISCSYAINPLSGSFNSDGDSDSFSVTTETGCDWTPAKTADWITLNSGAGSGNGSVSYSVSENTGLAPRSNTITVQDQIYTVNQQGMVSKTPDDFVTTWKTDNPGESNSLSILIPMLGGAYDVDWDNDGTFELFGVSGAVTHNYGVAGVYTVRIRGSFNSIRFNNGGDKEKILAIDQWGTNAWTTMALSFYGADNLVVPATDTPGFSAVTSMASMFFNASSANPDTSSWNTSSVTSMRAMFRGATAANPDTSSWNTGMVSNMSSMFRDATLFNRDIGSWDVSSLTEAGGMFLGVTLSEPNYESLLTGWSAQVLIPGVVFNGGNSPYCSEASVAAKSLMISADGWSISDGGQCLPPETCNEKTVSDVSENSDASHEACEHLNIGPGFTAENGADVIFSSGEDIEFIPGFLIEKGATLDANVCGRSLCKTSGSPMPYGCHSCIDQICDIDPACCGVEFSQACLDKVDTVCNLTCEQ